MKLSVHAAMVEATRLTKIGELGRAAALLQRYLGRRVPVDEGVVIDGVAAPLDDAARGFADLVKDFRGARGKGPHAAPPREPAAAGKAQFLSRQFACPAGTRVYKLYVPASYRGAPAPLIVMLHGCTQSPDDFAAGTRMNEAAEAGGFLVAYPAQNARANMQRCWNWFREADQRREGGEPAIIAGLTQEIMHDWAVDPARVYVAGLSAGGAAAAVMAQTYPDLYAAVGVHSGLACGAARTMAGAMAAMQQGSAGGAAAARVPAIVFHGDRDSTVNPRNGDAVVAQSAGGADVAGRVETGAVDGGHGFSRRIFADGTVEQWVVHGAGHAWSGGHAAGSYTDARGPDATAEMVRFFMAHPKR